MAASSSTPPAGLPWHPLEVKNIGKKTVLEYLQKEAPAGFLRTFKIDGAISNAMLKRVKQDDLVFAYKQFAELREDQLKLEAKKAAQAESPASSSSEGGAAESEAAPTAEIDEPKFTLQTLTKGDKATFPKPKDQVRIKYRGKLCSTGQIFDTNMAKKDKPLTVQLGVNKMIRGMEEALYQMSVGEVAQVIIKGEWAYPKGLPAAGIPPMADLEFELNLVSIV